MWLSTTAVTASIPLGLGDGERLFGEALALLERTTDSELGALQGEQEGAVSIVLGQVLDGQFKDGDLFVVQLAHGAEGPPVVGQCCRDEAVDVPEGLRHPRRPDESPAEPDVAALTLRRTEANGEVDLERLVGIVQPFVEVQCLGVVPNRVVGSQPRQRCVGRLFGVIDGLHKVHHLRGAHPVTGQLAHPEPRSVAPKGLQGLTDDAVIPRLPSRSELFVDEVLNEGMGEGVLRPAPGVLPDERHRPGRVQQIEEGVLRNLARLRQQVEVELKADHRRHREDALGVVPESHHACPNHVADAVREGREVQVLSS